MSAGAQAKRPLVARTSGLPLSVFTPETPMAHAAGKQPSASPSQGAPAARSVKSPAGA